MSWRKRLTLCNNETNANDLWEMGTVRNGTFSGGRASQQILQCKD